MTRGWIALVLAWLAALPAAAQPGVRLRLRVAGDTFDTGDDLGISLELVNGTAGDIEIVAPVYGSWEHAREPAYDTVLTDTATGAVVENALGYEEGLDCGVLDPISPQDRVTVPGNSTRAIPRGRFSIQQQRVLPSARPGTYTLRVHYRHGTTTLRSTPVTIRVIGGDAALWECRRRQLEALLVFRSVESRALGAAELAGSGPALLAFTRRTHDAATDAYTTQLWVSVRDARLQPVGSALRVFEARELGYPPAIAATSRGVLIAAVQDARGAERAMLREVRWDGAAPTLGPEHVLPRGRGLALALDAHGERAWLLQGDVLDGPLRLWRLDASGAPRGGPIEAVPAGEHTGGGLVHADAGGAWVAHRSRAEQRLVALRIDDAGRVVARTPALSAGGEATALRVDGDRLEITWRDNLTSGSDPRDGMGLMHGVFSRAGATLASRALSPVDRSDPRWGRAAWSGDRLGFAFADARGAVTFGTGEIRRELSSSGAEVELTALGDGWLASWDDRRDDASRGCLELGQCVTEVYAARLDHRGQVVVGATRITSDAVAAPPRPDRREWPRLCP